MRAKKIKLTTAKTTRTIAWASVRDYMDYLSDTRRIILNNFYAGLFRGVGTAVGFSLLGALVIYLVTLLASKNLPFIGDFINDLVDVIQKNK